MPRLVVNPRSEQAWEIPLRPGQIYLGRGVDNDIQLDNPSVSDRHCRIVITNGALQIEDLGSTNGTFIKDAVIQRGILRPGQTLRIGTVELLLEEDAPSGADAPRFETAESESGVETASSAQPKTIYCRNHYRNVARYRCPKCAYQFCDLCVNTRGSTGGGLKFCKLCGTQCQALAVKPLPPPPPFFSTVGPAFKYPFAGDGIMMLVSGWVFFAFLDVGNYAGRHAFPYGMRTMMMRAVIFSFILGTGYLVSHLKNIIACTAYGDDRMPDWPEFSQWKEDIVIPMFQLVVLAIVSFGPALALYLWSEGDWPWLTWPAFFVGCVYFPMAFLGIAMYDTLAALNPMFVFGSILRVPREYGVVALVFVGILTFRWLLEKGVALVVHVPLAPAVIADLISICLLMTESRILGMLYRCHRRELGWFKH